MIKGFFTDDEIEKGTRVKINLDRIGPECRKDCMLYRNVKSPRMKYSGDGKKKALIVGEAPGANEDELNTQFEKHAQAGGYLRQELSLHNLDLDRDFYKTNAVCCRPTKKGKGGGLVNRAPDSKEIRACRPLLEQTIREVDPKYIFLLGGTAVESFYLDKFKRKSITRFRGTCIPDQRYGKWIIPMFHPSFIIRDVKNQNLTSQFSRDMKFAISKLSLPSVTVHDYEKHVEIVTNYDSLISRLDNIIAMQPEKLEIDFETTGLKPFRPGHKILSISLGTTKDHVISFPFSYRSHWDKSQFVMIKRKIRRILTHPKIKKMAHNIQFEYVWAKQILGIEISPWCWDSMIAAHILDNRREWTGLKFQTYINFGFYPYDDPVAPYIKGFPFNRLEDCPLKDLLHYGALDSLFGFRLEAIQRKQFEERGEKLLGAYEFFEKGTLAMGRLELRGVHIDEDYFETQSNSSGTGIIDTEIDKLMRQLTSGEEATLFKRETGKELDIDSSKDLGELIYDILKYPKILTEKGNLSVDEKALQKIKLPFTKNLLRVRKLSKLSGTYMAQFKRFAFEGKIHPSYGLNIPATYRSSSYDPNLHNIPKHDKFSKRACRKGIKARPDHGLLSSDFSGIEVGISACYNKDKNLIKYITDEKTDMHRDSAADIWMLPHEEINGDIRFTGKNGWVFPQFYNSYYVNCARDLWNDYLDLEINSGITLREHMAKKGIRTLAQFTNHCKTVEDKFWGERFSSYKKWKDKVVKEYIKNGYLETYFGFQFVGYMTRNECCNYQTQGTAFHCLLWTLMQVDDHAIKNKWDSMLCGQIHDDMITDYNDDELGTVIETINYYGTEEIRDRHKWIIIPLKIDHEISGVNGNWAEMEEVK